MVPIPILFLKYGPALRRKSKFAPTGPMKPPSPSESESLEKEEEKHEEADSTAIIPPAVDEEKPEKKRRKKMFGRTEKKTEDTMV